MVLSRKRSKLLVGSDKQSTSGKIDLCIARRSRDSFELFLFYFSCFPAINYGPNFEIACASFLNTANLKSHPLSVRPALKEHESVCTVIRCPVLRVHEATQLEIRSDGMHTFFNFHERLSTVQCPHQHRKSGMNG